MKTRLLHFALALLLPILGHGATQPIQTLTITNIVHPTNHVVLLVDQHLGTEATVWLINTSNLLESLRAYLNWPTNLPINATASNLLIETSAQVHGPLYATNLFARQISVGSDFVLGNGEATNIEQYAWMWADEFGYVEILAASLNPIYDTTLSLGSSIWLENGIKFTATGGSDSVLVIRRHDQLGMPPVAAGADVFMGRLTNYGNHCVFGTNYVDHFQMAASAAAGKVLTSDDAGTAFWLPQTNCLGFAAGADTNTLTAGTAALTFRMPQAMTLKEVRASIATAQTSGNIITIDVNESGGSVLSTKLTIDNTEKTSKTAATAAVISDAALGDDSEITIDLDQVGDGTAKGLKIWLIGTNP